eukprot:scaffold7409_cov75-Isochrysis_galbana.AAC.1
MLGLPCAPEAPHPPRYPPADGCVGPAVGHCPRKVLGGGGANVQPAAAGVGRLRHAFQLTGVGRKPEGEGVGRPRAWNRRGGGGGGGGAGTGRGAGTPDSRRRGDAAPRRRGVGAAPYRAEHGAGSRPAGGGQRPTLKRRHGCLSAFAGATIRVARLLHRRAVAQHPTAEAAPHQVSRHATAAAHRAARHALVEEESGRDGGGGGGEAGRGGGRLAATAEWGANPRGRRRPAPRPVHAPPSDIKPLAIHTRGGAARVCPPIRRFGAGHGARSRRGKLTRRRIAADVPAAAAAAGGKAVDHAAGQTVAARGAV